MTGPKFIMEVKVHGAWRAVGPSEPDGPYMYDTRAEAAAMLEMCYPDQCNESRLEKDFRYEGAGGVRVTRIER